MLTIFSGFICLLIIREGLGCIPMKPDDGIYITIPAIDPICLSPPWTVFFFIENGVDLEVGPSPELGMKAPVETCNVDYSNGRVRYYDGRTPVDWTMADMNEAAGFWNRQNCADPCVCTANACYQPRPGDPTDIRSPIIYFYPHCNGSMDCFMVVVFYSTGSLVNPNNPTDMFDTNSQMANVNDPSFPKVTNVGCTGCPVEMQK